jgi:hypothetical protein
MLAELLFRVVIVLSFVILIGSVSYRQVRRWLGFAEGPHKVATSRTGGSSTERPGLLGGGGWWRSGRRSAAPQAEEPSGSQPEAPSASEMSGERAGQGGERGDTAGDATRGGQTVQRVVSGGAAGVASSSSRHVLAAVDPRTGEVRAISSDLAGGAGGSGSRALISGVTRRSRPGRGSASGWDGRSRFVPARLGLPVLMGGVDVWSQWPDAHRRNIRGALGTALLESVFDAVSGSRAGRILDDLVRKGIEVSFGEPGQFGGALAGAVATFRYVTSAQPPAAPPSPPAIIFNPAFLGEDPRALAAALVHEATHFQQYLDGSLLGAGGWSDEIEFAAWWNEAAVWDELRGASWPIDTTLEAEAEFMYRTALRGEAALKNVLSAFQAD